MWIIFQYYYGFLQKRADRIEVEHDAPVDYLIKVISDKLQKSSKDFILKFRRDG